jgi:carboxymethylenebutenolidase
MAACRTPGVAACVSFYGMLRHSVSGAHKLPPPIDTAADLRCPLLGLYGADDPLIPPDDLRTFEEALRQAGKTFALRVWAGAGHAFLNDRRPDAYRPQAAEEAFREAVAFLNRSLS